MIINRPKIFDKYKHYKGNLYQVLGLYTHTETKEELVCYQTLYGEYSFWARPIEMFCSQVEINGLKKPRFELIE